MTCPERKTVDLHTYARALRKRWKIIPASMMIMLCLAAIATALTPKTYASHVQFFVSTSDSSDSTQLAQGNTFTQQRVKSYTQLVTTPKILGPVASDTKIPGGAATVQPLVSASAAPDTVIINTTVTSTSPNRSQAVAKSLANRFPKAVAELESTSGQSKSPVKVTVVQEPSDKAKQVGPNWPLNLGLALVLGALLGLGLALLRDRLDTKVRTKDDVEEVDDAVTVLGTIPFDSDAPDHPLALATDAHSGRSEAFRALRTNLQFIDAAEHPRTIVLTSSIAGEGKSTTTANLAYAIAESGASVCLIEADLRRPRLLKYLGLEGGVGLTDVLIGRAQLRDVVQRYGDHKLMILGAGATPPNPSELLGSQAMVDVLADLRERFDYVIIDAPPLLPVTDGAVLSKITDGAVLVTGSGLVKREQLVAALDTLDGVKSKTLGVVMNRVPRNDRGNYYDYKYEYAPEEPSGSKETAPAPSRKLARKAKQRD